TPVSGIINVTGRPDAYKLEQNYPNPFTGIATIAFDIPHNTYVSLKVYSVLGEEITELAGKEYVSGKHTVDFNATGLSKGIYFYTLKTDSYSVSRTMILQTE
ncbi:MAG: T9SS type A sorting domain-containing protein, partial [Bacteroidales bacterium]